MDPQVKQDEVNHLAETLSKISLGNRLLVESMERMGAGTLDKLKDLREDPESGADFYLYMEQLQEKNAAFNFKDKFKRLEEHEFLLKEPYFARIDITDPLTNEYLKLYIGKFGFFDKEPVVTDWRSKVASIYYRYRYPQKAVKYDTDSGIQTKDLNLKRTYEIENAELVKYYNNDIQLDENEIIQGKISKRTGGVLEDIVETIQLGQLDIIEADPRQVCIVQGCVGSGKSTVAIHKLAHIFFNFANIIHPERSILVTKNQILIGYLSTLFPKLGIFDISYKTLRELAVHVIFREEMGIKVDLDKGQDTRPFTVQRIEELKQKIDEYHKKTEQKLKEIFSSSETEPFAGYKYSKLTTPYTNVSEQIAELEEEALSQRDFIKENPNHTRSQLYKDNIKIIRKIIRELNQLRHEVKITYMNELSRSENIKTSEKLGYMDTLVYLFAYSEIVGITKYRNYEYCVVDEGQDFSVLEYLFLNKLVLRGRLAIFGDLNQSLDVDGITNWNDIPKVISDAKNANIFKLETNYRSTKPIIDLANKVLSKYTNDYLPKSINRKGNDPEIIKVSSNEALLEKFEQLIKIDTQELNKSIGVIINDANLYESVEKILQSLNLDPEKLIQLTSTVRIKYIPKGVYYTAFEDCKGLEFAKVYVLGLNLDKIDGFANARKAFVAITRAMNELHILGVE